MNTMHPLGSTHRRAIQRAVALSSLLALPLSAQEGEEIFTLSPFSVSAENNGYTATETMAGTRLRTQIADTPASLSILTEDFLNDLGATDIQSIASFLPSTENYSMIGIDTAGNGVKAGNNISVRGFSSDTRTRNFFQSEGSSDRYLTESLTASRGPNSLLFGIGNPGGAILVSTKRAHFGKNKGQAELQLDDVRDGGYRATFDQNLVLIDDKLAFRVSSVNEERDGFREPEKTRIQGLFATATWAPFESGNSVFRLNYENEKRDRTVARPWAPYDFFSNWADQGAPLYDNLKSARPAAAPSSANPFRRFENAFINIIDQDDINTYRTALTKTYKGSVTSSGKIVNGVEEENISLTQDFKALNPLDLLKTHFNGNDAAVESWLASLGAGRSIPESFASQELVIPMDTWFAGDLDDYQSNLDAVSAFWEQKFGDNLFIEVAANFEDSSTDSTVTLRNNEYAIAYDPNLYLPDGSPNPYAGVPFVGGFAAPNESISEQTTEEYRVTVSYNLDLSENKLFDRIDLGRHQLSVLANTYNKDFLTIQRQPVIYEWEGAPIGDAISKNNGVMNNLAKLSGRYYLLPGKQPYIPEAWTPIEGEGVVGKSDYADVQYFSNDTTIDSYAFGTQSFFFNNRLVLTGGIREDILNFDQGIKVPFTRETENPANGDYFGELDVPTSRVTIDHTEEQSWTNKSYGAVYHLIRGEGKGFVDRLSLFYNSATNVSASPERLNIRWQEISPKNGEGADYGLKFDLFDSKLTGTITKFETTMLNDFRNSALGIFSRSGVGGIFNLAEAVDRDAYNRRQGASIAWAPIFDSTTEGIEFEAVWNPVKNLRLRATFSSLENTPSRFGEDIQEYYNELKPKALEFIAAHPEPGPNAPVPSDDERALIDLAAVIQGVIPTLDVQVPLKQAFNGVPIPGVPKNKGSLSANYRFDEGTFLKGFSAGLTMQYRSAAPVAFETNDVLESNLDNALMSETQYNYGLSLSYRRKLSDKYDWRVQLNVRNLLDDTDPLLMDGVWDRSTQQFVTNRNRMTEPRSFILTNSLAW